MVDFSTQSSGTNKLNVFIDESVGDWHIHLAIRLKINKSLRLYKGSTRVNINNELHQRERRFS
jgi:hypothetical protein